MSIVNNYIFKNLRLKLSKENYWDLVLSSDLRGYDHTTLYCNDPITGNTLVSYFDFSTLTGNTVHSLTTWKDSLLPKTGLTLCDIGLTGIDNGFVPNLTGETLFISSADSRFFMTKVTGTTYVYPTTVTGDSSGNYIKFCGGFYQGFYKLENYPIKKISNNKFLECKKTDSCENSCLTSSCSCGCGCPPPEEPNPVIEYQVLPNRFSDGWTAEFWLKREDNCILIQSGTTLNDVYPNNKGFFFTMGLRSENKFWDFFSGETGYVTCLDSGHTISPPISYTDPMSGMNPFLYYGLIGCENDNCNTCGENSCDCVDNKSYPIYRDKDYISDIVDNIIGFRIKNDGSIGYRKIVFSGNCSGSTVECCRTSGGTYVTGYTIEESYSTQNLIPLNNCTQVVVRYKTDYSISEDNLDCPCSNSFKQFCPRPGELSFYINGYLKHRVKGVKELIPRALDEYPEKQLAVPYSISIGGGTQGLIESKTFGGTDTRDLNLPIQQNFAGSFIGGISKFRFYSEPLDVTKIRCNFYYDKDKYGVINNLPDENHNPEPLEVFISLMASYSPGSIVATYSAMTDTILNEDIKLDFINKIQLKNGTYIQVNPEIIIPSGQKIGITTIKIEESFSNLSGDFEFNKIRSLNSDISNNKLNIPNNVIISPVDLPDPPGPPKPIINSIYYGKLNTTDFTVSGLTSLNKIDVNDGRNTSIKLPLGVGYGYILISNNLKQPTLFRNSDEGCAGFIIPIIKQGQTSVIDNNGNSVIYNVYRTFVSTKASVDIWLCD